MSSTPTSPGAKGTHVLDAFRLNGRRALITGGARGLGQVIATALAQAGADVAITSRDESGGQRAAAAISEDAGGRVRAFRADFDVAGDDQRLVEAVNDALGGIDILVNNAGINVRGPSETIAEKDWAAVLHTNLTTPFLLSRLVGPQMVKRGWGRIVNLASILGTVALPGRAPYASSKAGVINLTRVLALEWAGSGVTANAICPGVFGTELNRPLMNDPEKYQEMVRRIPMGRWGEVHELAGAALFLSSEASSYVTGTCLYVDGGWTAW